MWADFLKNTVLRPGLQRLGTVGAFWLLAGGDWLCQNAGACGLVDQPFADRVATVVVALGLVAFDITLIHLDRAKKRK